MNIKVIFEKQAKTENLSSGWGVSYLINNKMLFDLGEKKEFFEDNIKKMNIDPKKFEKVVISHNHWDHWGGLNYLLQLNKKLDFFVTSDFYQEFNCQLGDHRVEVIEQPKEISRNIHSLGSFKVIYKERMMNEQALCLKTEKGLTIICGCAHPGVLEYVKKAKELFKGRDIYLIMGGFHLIDKDKRVADYVGRQLKEENVFNIAPGHCTGFDAVQILKRYYPDNLIDIGAGQEIEV
ncbi:MAG: MBL fold metallo-hydrolase [Candidatus Omnitrophica bacterium]|nr:MBL fold metallo-hydrolase [Candidatus Omnitrophota bacterium]